MRNLNLLLGSTVVLLLTSVGLSMSVVASVRAIPFQSYIAATTAATLCAGTADPCQDTLGWISGAVRMVCYEDANWTDGQSHRWFYVQTAHGFEGFVRAGAVSNQTGTPLCNTISWLNATAWALGQDGKAECSSVASNCNATIWSAHPWLFAYDSWSLGTGRQPIFDAPQALLVWTRYHDRSLTRPPSNMPPRGSLVFFSHGTTGYVAISLGFGWVEGTQGDVESEKKPVTHMKVDEMARNGETMLGYVPVSQI